MPERENGNNGREPARILIVYSIMLVVWYIRRMYREIHLLRSSDASDLINGPSARSSRLSNNNDAIVRELLARVISRVFFACRLFHKRGIEK